MNIKTKLTLSQYLSGKIETIILIFITLIGFYFRLKGISTNQSFWSDEAFVSTIAKNIINGNTSYFQGIKLTPYQPLQILSTVLSFQIFGISEWSSRIFSVFWGSLGIIYSYLLSKKYSNRWGGLLAAFFYSFLQLNLSYSTQAKPYSAISTLFLMTIYYLDKKLFLSFLFAFLAFLFNYNSLFIFIPVFIQLGSVFIKKKLSRKYLLYISISLFFIIFILIQNMDLIKIMSIQYNWITYTRDLFWRQYGFITLPALFGLFLIKEKRILFGTAISSITLLFMWNFVLYSHNVRYLLPIFSLMIVLFGVFWAKVGDKLFNNSLIPCLFVMLAIFAGGYKVVRIPSVYYTPNGDFFEDVQNADYKKFFSLWRQKYPDFESYPIFTGVFDSLSWYTNRYPTSTFSKFTATPYLTKFGYTEYGGLEQFIDQKSQYPKGFVMIHDWQSFMPDDIKEYVKKNLKLEIRVESMEVSPNDKWPLELYSWGFEEKK